MYKVRVRGIDNELVYGTGATFRAAIFDSAVQLSGRKIKIRDEVVECPVFVEG